MIYVGKTGQPTRDMIFARATLLTAKYGHD